MSKPIDTLKSSIEYLKGVGPARADLLKKELGIHTFKDLLFHFPFRYVDRSKFNKTNERFRDGDIVQFVGEVVGMELIKGKNNRKRLSAQFKDSAGFCELTWFSRIAWIEDFLKKGLIYIVYGRVKKFGGKLSIVHPEMEVYDKEKANKQSHLYPVYSTTEKLTKKNINTRVLAKLTKELMGQVRPSALSDPLPSYLHEKLNLLPYGKALSQIHYPVNDEQKEEAVNRIKFDELFFLQLRLLLNKISRKKKIRGQSFEKVGDNFHAFYNKHLSFELTGAQKRVIREIRNDMGSGMQMNRLLQGDVGSGKTIVALLCMLIAIDNGFQACLMAPTEILAYQHFQSIQNSIEGIGLNVGLLTGSVKGKTRSELLNALKEGKIHILIGTHALIEKPVEYQNLGLAITDEQHRFGVQQRAKLWTKTDAHPPHILVMTATPIPRTLSMTIYGDLDVSVIDELPPGRKEIKTVHLFETKRPRMIEFLKKEIALGRQIYVVFPLIEESEKLDLRNLMDGYDQMLHHFPRPEYQLSVVHGRMKPADKEFEMNRFKKGETNILVGTTVIEVGVDVPNASVMVIENAERFGLSQLHQLRGRVGRGGDQSYCLLMSSYKLSTEAKERLQTMVRTNNGFEIAEVDMQLRGPGDMEGTRQSGLLDFKLVNLTQDQNILVTARHICEKVLEEDPFLQLPKNEKLLSYVKNNPHLFRSWGRIS